METSVDVAPIEALVGPLRATYVLGGAYQTEVNAAAQVNMAIGRVGDPDLPPGPFNPAFRLRPDIQDHQNLTVYEIKSEREAPAGRAEVLVYIATLALRYPRPPPRVYTPGRWRPAQQFYTITGLPGITGLPYLTIEAWNDGGGVIAYRVIPDEKWVAALVVITELVHVAIKSYQARMQSAPAQCPGLILGLDTADLGGVLCSSRKPMPAILFTPPGRS